MSKKPGEVPLSSQNGEWVCEITAQDVSYLEGRILTIVETIGLKETQEKSVKDLLRGEIWKLWDSYRLHIRPFPTLGEINGK